MTQDSLLDTYDRIAQRYAASRSQSLFERGWLDRALAHTPRNGPQRRALDLGCGAGLPMARYLSERRLEVTGVDGAPQMLALFTQNLPRAEAIHADMRSLALDRTFDLILAWDSLFHLSPDDQRAMFPIFAAHAAPNAALMFTTGSSAGEVIGTAGGAEIYHASLEPAEYDALLSRAGFKRRAHIVEDPSCGHHTVWLATYAGHLN